MSELPEIRIYHDPQYGTIMECDDYEYADNMEDFLIENYDDTDEVLNGFQGNTYIFYFGDAITPAELQARVGRFQREIDH